MTTPKAPHGGTRAGAGRKPRGAAAGTAYTVRLAPEEVSEIVAVLRQGEKIVGLLREGGIALARRRAARVARGGR